MNDDNNMKFMCMIIDKTVDEGEEFLKYAYPSTTPIAVHFIEMRMTFAALDNIMYSINGQSMEKSQFIKEKQAKQEKNNNEFYNEIPDSFSAVSIKLTGQLKGWNFILITWDNDIIANNVYIIALRLLQLISMTNGPLRKIWFKIPSNKSSSNSNNNNLPTLILSLSAMYKLDPCMRILNKTLMNADNEGIFLESFLNLYLLVLSINTFI